MEEEPSSFAGKATGTTKDHSSSSNAKSDANDNHNNGLPDSNTSQKKDMKKNKSKTQRSSSSLPDPSKPVPELLPNNSITFGELQTCVKVLNAVAELKPSKKNNNNNKKRKFEANGVGINNKEEEEEDSQTETTFARYKHSNLRPFRKALMQCLELHEQTMYEGKTKSEYYKARDEQRTLKRQKCSERDLQRNYIAATQLRQGRVNRLQAETSEAKDEEEAKLKAMMMIPDGHVETETNGDSEKLLLTNETSNSKDDIGKNGNKVEKNVDDNVGDEPVQLPIMRSCYVCKTRFRQLHHFYDQLCPSCAALNWQKRHQTCDLRGKIAIVTGSRVKIGFQTCLKLLRAGCTVIATTRFPNMAVENFRKESDFTTWENQLQVYGLDLRDVTGIEAFCRFLKMQYGECGIDVLINNACQTVRRPTKYYLPNCQKEEELWQSADKTHRTLLKGCLGFERIRHQLLKDHKQQGGGDGFAAIGNGDVSSASTAGTTNQRLLGEEQPSTGEIETIEEPAATAMVTTTSESDAAVARRSSTATPFENTGMSHSAAMSQMILLPEDVGIDDQVLPPGVTDINGQQLDLRKTNSWLLRMEEVTTPEIMECMFINAIAPFVLNSRLKPLMCTPAGDANRPDRFIVNVSAMEGKFYRYKMANHPHTNMAKAALNMMTRTSAEDLAVKHRIYMNSVDTGWINDENPLERASKTAKLNNFQTPIDEIDAAARILDPIFTGCSNSNSESSDAGGDKPTTKDYGKFLKDYHETEW